MEIPLSVVLHVLKEFGPEVWNTHYLRPDTFAGILFLGDGSDLDPAYLYICTTADFGRIPISGPVRTILCFGDSDEAFQSAPKGRNTLIRLPLRTMSAAVNKLAMTFTRLRQWEEELERFALSGAPVQQMVNVSEGLFANPFLILDSSHKVIAVGKNQVGANPYFTTSIANGFLPVKFLKRMIDRGFISSDKIIPGIATLAKPNIADCILLISAISPMRYQYGYLLQFCEQEPPSDYEKFLIGILVSKIELMLSKDRAALDRGRNYDDYLVEELLDRTYKKPELLAERARLAGVSLHGRFQLFLIAMDQEFIRQNIRVETALRALGFNYKIGIYKSDVVLLRNICADTGPEKREADDLSRIRHILKDYKAEIGISDEFSELALAYNAYTQAKFAIKLGCLQDMGRDEYFYDDYYAYHICAICAEQVDPHTLIYEPFRRLIAHDKKTGGNDVELLEVFLTRNCNASEVAKVMNLHRNSVHYRVKRMEELMQVRIDEPNVRLRLLTSIRLLRYVKWKNEEKENVIPYDF